MPNIIILKDRNNDMALNTQYKQQGTPHAF